MSQFREILLKYWGYDAFRYPQEEIIKSVSEGKDTLGLMPTGGGKSITFQVFSMANSGVCLVITPLIALMKDQVANLQKRGIKAVAIYSGMTQHEIEVAVDNATYGDYKFLYLSPERLKNYYFRERLKVMHVNLITVDEAHCISQWGYDFRPPYLEIAEIREILPDVPVLALTATATPEVVDDIQDRLKFPVHNVFQKSFERKNLVYYVINTEDKVRKLFYIVNKVQGSGVFYVRNRKKTREYAMLLQQNGISADFYHAGLSAQERSEKQEAWQKNQIRIMVCTNAFGMGIDKPDVRLVIHLDLPDSPEAYFQEAGRAGRDGKRAYAFLLTNNADKVQVKKNITTSFPELPKVKEVYSEVCSYLGIPYECGANQDVPFDIFNFSAHSHIDVLTVHNCLKTLEFAGFLEYTEDTNTVSRVMFEVRRDDLYKFQIENKNLDEFIKLILRMYTGLFTDFVNISEEYIAKKAGISEQSVYEYLKTLAKQGIISYIPKTNRPLIRLLMERHRENDMFFDMQALKSRKDRVVSKMEAMLRYATSDNKCRSQQLLAYFGETDVDRCGECDVCQRRNELGLSKYEFDIVLEKIKRIVNESPCLYNELIDKVGEDENKTINVIKWLFDNQKILYNNERKIIWHK